MFNPNQHQNPVEYKQGSNMDPYSENFDYDEYKRRWFGSFKHSDVYTPLILVFCGLCLAFSVLIWPCTSKYKIRAIAGFLITYLSTQVVVKAINRHLNEGDDQQ